jgi:hypothetical protein
MDNISPSRVRSMGGKLYVIVVVDDYSHYSFTPESSFSIYYAIEA